MDARGLVALRIQWQTCHVNMIIRCYLYHELKVSTGYFIFTTKELCWTHVVWSPFRSHGRPATTILLLAVIVCTVSNEYHYYSYHELKVSTGHFIFTTGELCWTHAVWSPSRSQGIPFASRLPSKSATHRDKSREWKVSKQKWNLC